MLMVKKTLRHPVKMTVIIISILYPKYDCLNYSVLLIHRFLKCGCVFKCIGETYGCHNFGMSQSIFDIHLIKRAAGKSDISSY